MSQPWTVVYLQTVLVAVWIWQLRCWGAMESWQPDVFPPLTDNWIQQPPPDTDPQRIIMYLINENKIWTRVWEKKPPNKSCPVCLTKTRQKELIKDMRSGFKRTIMSCSWKLKRCWTCSKRHSVSTSINEALCAYLSRSAACKDACYKTTSFPRRGGERPTPRWSLMRADGTLRQLNRNKSSIRRLLREPKQHENRS